MSRTLQTRTRYKLVGSDYSAQEPRLTAFMSQDPEMIQAYIDGKDLYAVIAQSMYNNEYEDNLECYPAGTIIEIDGKQVVCGKKTHINEEGKHRRKTAKTMLLAILYGMSAATAGRRMGKTKDEGEALMNKFFARFPKVKQLIEDSKSMLVLKGYVEDWAGRRRHLPDYFLPDYGIEYKDPNRAKTINFNPFIECADRDYQDTKMLEYLEKASRTRFNSEFNSLAKEALSKGYILFANTGRKAQAERQCLNARIQGGAASLTKLAMVNIENDARMQELDAKLVITVHDEVLVECPAAYADEVVERLPQLMIDTAKPYINVPMSCDPYSVDRWYADVAASSLRKEFEDFITSKKHPLTKEDATQKIIDMHPEYSVECIMAALSSDGDLNF